MRLLSIPKGSLLFDEMIFTGKAVATVVDGEFVMKDGVVLK